MWIQILMSTYNGEQYLEEQLDSILAQSYPHLKLLIRDDGSTDGTTAILQRYSEIYENIAYYRGANIGVIASFFDLLRHSDDSADYYGFADQDDKWLPEKTARAVNRLRRERQSAGEDIPLLYCSDTCLTDERLNVLHNDNKCPKPSFGNALVQNICTGCTAVFNRALRDIVCRTQPENIVMHDWWLYLSASIFGSVCYDNEAYILYRQHGKNAYGMKKNTWDILRYRIGQLSKKRGYIYEQLAEVKKWYPQMPQKYKKMLNLVLESRKGLRNRLRLIANRSIYRNSRTDDLVYRLIVLIGKL